MREACIERKTNETEVEILFSLEESSAVHIQTGVGFLDHMLELMARHGRFGLKAEARGDLHVDAHHTVEDVGIVLGQAVKTALGAKEGINRYGHALVPMDEALASVILDISGRPFLHFQAEFRNPKLGDFDTELVQEFLRAFAFHAGITLHVHVVYGENTHHKIEAIFKALGRAFCEAAALNPAIKGVNSTKGLIE